MNMTEDGYEKIGKSCRSALDGNLLIGSFAADMIGEGYPINKSLWDILFRVYTDVDLGKKFVEWMNGSKK